MSYKYSRYFSRVTRQPWAITPEKLAVLVELARFRAAGNRLSDQEIAARVGAETSASETPTRQDGAVAVIPVHGVIAHRADSFDASSGGTSAEGIGRMLQRAVGEDSVTAIVLDFSTPGGSVEGIPELAAQIVKATAVKPVIAQINALAASAGYWLASQASEIVITPSGQAGSIGVFMLLIDESEWLAKEGIKVNAISAGEYKLEGAPWLPLSDESRAHFKGQIETVYRDFVATVARGRGVTVSEVKKTFGQGRVYDAKESLARGMVDRIATLDDTLLRLVGSRRGGGRRAEGAAEGGIVAETPPEAAVLADAEARDVKSETVTAVEAAQAAAIPVSTEISPATDAENDAVALVIALGE